MRIEVTKQEDGTITISGLSKALRESKEVEQEIKDDVG